jgi:hypothetical protein
VEMLDDPVRDSLSATTLTPAVVGPAAAIEAVASKMPIADRQVLFRITFSLILGPQSHSLPAQRLDCEL